VPITIKLTYLKAHPANTPRPPVRIARTLGIWIAGLAAFAVVLVAAFRLINGLDLLTGDDPRTVAASRSNPDLEINGVPASLSTYEVIRHADGLRGYFRLTSGETLTGDLQFTRCGNSGNQPLPDWLPRFPKAKEWACIIVATDQGEQHHASFVSSLELLEEAYGFYTAALETFPYTTGGESIQRQPMSGTQFRNDTDTGRRVLITYYYDGPGGAYLGPFVTIAYTDGR
jgi:hypothetical protein